MQDFFSAWYASLWPLLIILIVNADTAIIAFLYGWQVTHRPRYRFVVKVACAQILFAFLGWILIVPIDIWIARMWFWLGATILFMVFWKELYNNRLFWKVGSLLKRLRFCWPGLAAWLIGIDCGWLGKAIYAVALPKTMTFIMLGSISLVVAIMAMQLGYRVNLIQNNKRAMKKRSDPRLEIERDIGDNEMNVLWNQAE